MGKCKLTISVFLKFLFFTLIIYFGMKMHHATLNYSLFLPNHDPKSVWSFLSDFTNIPSINPKM